MTTTPQPRPRPQQQESGLFVKDRLIPLAALNAQCTIHELASRVVLSQIYILPTVDDGTAEKNSVGGGGGIEATYVFPLDADAAVNEFSVDVETLKEGAADAWELQDRIVGKVKPREVARQEYEDAIVEGRSATALVEKTQDNSNIFRVQFMIRSPPTEDRVVKQRLSVHLGYVSQIGTGIFDRDASSTAEDKKVKSEEGEENNANDNGESAVVSSLDELWQKLVLPVTLTPKYRGGNTDPSTDNADYQYEPVDIVHARAHDLPTRFGVIVRFSEKCSTVRQVQCPTHQVDLVRDSANADSIREIKFTQDTVQMGTDLKIYFRSDQYIAALQNSNQQVNAKQEAAGNEYAIVEEYDVADIDQQKYAVMIPVPTPVILEEDEGTETINSELIFVVDCSGSMSGSCIREARRTLNLFLRSLPLDQGIKINIVRFGSRYVSLYPISARGSKILNETTLNEAMRYAEATDADLGGTELFEPLKALFESIDQSDGYARMYFILTDGQIYNTDSTLRLVRTHAQHIRVFTAGIGSCDQHLVNGLAKTGGGTAEFIAYGEKIDAKVLGQLRRALKPTWTNISVSWGNPLTTQCGLVKCHPDVIPPAYYGELHMFYALCNTLPSESCEITFTAFAPSSNGRGARFQRKFTLDRSRVQKGSQVHVLAANAKIKILETDKQRMTAEQKKEVETLSVRYQIVSSQGSFVAVSEKYASSEAQQKPIASVQVPSAIPEDKEMHQMLYQSSPPMRMMSMAPMYDMGSSLEQESLMTAAPMFKRKAMVKGGIPVLSNIGASLSGLFSRGRGSAPAPPPPPPAAPMGMAMSMPPPPPAPSAAPMRDMKMDVASSSSASDDSEFCDEECDDDGFNFFEDAQVEKEVHRSSNSMKPMKKLSKSIRAPAQQQQQPAPTAPPASCDSILFAQKPAGNWEWSDNMLEQFVGADKYSKLKELTKSINANIVATAVFLALLESKFATQKSTWSLIHKKGRIWLKKAGQEALIAQVSAIIDA